MTKFAVQKLSEFFAAELREPRKARGCKFVVHVQADDGSWCELDANDLGQARLLARNWVEKLGAQCAHCRIIYPSGMLRAFAFYTCFWQPKAEPENYRS